VTWPGDSPGYPEYLFETVRKSRPSRPWIAHTFALTVAGLCVTIVTKWLTSARGVIAATGTAQRVVATGLGSGVRERLHAAISRVSVGVCVTPEGKRLIALGSELVRKK
jgi:hypothetical protein